MTAAAGRAGCERRAGAGLGGITGAMVAIFAHGLAVRLAVIAACPRFLPTPDGLEYQRIAENVLGGAGWSAAPGDSLWHPRSWRTPGYPLFIAPTTRSPGGGRRAPCT